MKIFPWSRSPVSRVKSLHFPVASAYLCEDCSLVGNDAHRCACGSRALLKLANVLNRETIGEYERERVMWSLEREEVSR